MEKTLTQIDDDDFRAYLLTHEAYASYWPHIEKELDRVPHIWNPWWTKEFLQICQLQGINVWGAGDGHGVHIFVWTRVANYPASTLFQILLAIGNRVDECLPHLEAVFEKASMMLGCTDFEIIGREGWGRKLKGCKRVATVFHRPVTNYGVH